MSEENEQDKGKEKEEKQEGDKTVNIEASAEVEDHKGDVTHEVDLTAKAKVRNLQDKKAEKGDVKCAFCSVKGEVITAHWNIDCPVVQARASEGAADTKEKVAVAGRPSSFSQRGTVD